MNNNIWKNYIYTYISENNLLDFYTKFLESFEEEWDKITSNYNFENLCQLNNGNRLRPMLVFWGYLLNKNDDELFVINDQDLQSIMSPCVMVESIHKMSLLIDDWIDGDIARHGIDTFHMLYGADITVLLAMNLMLSGFKKLNNLNEKIYKQTTLLSLEIAYDMTLGALSEISSKNSFLDVAEVKEIINLETASIIRNGMIIGYVTGEGDDQYLIDLLDDIGYCCGYIFQALNDLEPFSNAHELIRHKGALTTDILKDRKNIVIAYIYAWANEKEVGRIPSLDDPTMMFNYITMLLDKYYIKEYILSEISNLQLRIHNRIKKIETQTNHHSWCKHFNDFINITISASKKRALC